MRAGLPAGELRERLLAVCARILAERDRLTEADRAIGDGDHGITIARAFAAAKQALEGEAPSVAGDLRVLGGRLLAAGGTTGIVFGTLFRTLAREVGEEELTASALADGLARAVEEISRRAGARPGDKTMLDALAPAAEAVRAEAGSGIDAALAAAAEAARRGAEETRSMLPRAGRARTLGERAVGYPDPGALSVAIIFEALAHGSSEARRSGADG